MRYSSREPPPLIVGPFALRCCTLAFATPILPLAAQCWTPWSSVSTYSEPWIPASGPPSLLLLQPWLSSLRVIDRCVHSHCAILLCRHAVRCSLWISTSHLPLSCHSRLSQPCHSSVHSSRTKPWRSAPYPLTVSPRSPPDASRATCICSLSAWARVLSPHFLPHTLGSGASIYWVSSAQASPLCPALPLPPQ